MSHISQLTLKNLKGVNASFDLGKLTYIHGPNRSNKTSVIDGIQVGLLGYHPALPKTNAGTAELSSGDVMMVGVGFADGAFVQRIYTNGKSVKAEVRPSDWETDLRMLPSLDHSLYFGKSDNERVQQVMNLSEGLGSAERVPAIMARLKNIKTKTHDAVSEKILQQLLTEIPQYKSGPVQAWLAELLEWSKDRTKQENTRTKNFENTNETLTEANSIDALMEQNNKVNLKASLDKFREEEKAIIASHAQLTERIRGEIREYQLREQLLSKINGVPTPAQTQDQLAQSIAELTRTAAELKLEMEKILKEGEDKKSIVTSNQSTISSWERSKAETQDKMSEIEKLECCPMCKAAQDGWKIGATSLYLSQIDQANAEIERLKPEMEAAGQALDEIRKRYKQVDARITINRKSLEEANRQSLDGAQNDARLRVWRSQLETMPEREQPVLPPLESPELTKVRQVIMSTEAKMQVIEAHEAERARIAQVKQIAVEARAALELSKLITDTIREEQAHIVQDAFGPVLEVANMLTSGILKTPLAYYEGHVGRYLDDGRFIPVATFSGSEARLAFTAITAGLARQAKHKISIIDEIGTFDDESRTKLISNALYVIEQGVLDQIILVGVSSPPIALSETANTKIITCG